jgi:hypothetical protein
MGYFDDHFEERVAEQYEADRRQRQRRRQRQKFKQRQMPKRTELPRARG